VTPDENIYHEPGSAPVRPWLDGRRLLAALTAHLKSTFFRNMLVLMSGTVLAQIVTVAAAPILTRLYDPSAFGIAAAFGAIVGFVVSPTLCYDQALMLPKETKDSVNLLGLALLSVTGISMVMGVVCIAFSGPITAAAKTPELQPWLWLAPFAVFFAGLAQTLTAWSTRRKAFHRASISQVVRSVTTSGTQLGAGLQHAGFAALIGGGILGDALASAALAGQVIGSDRHVIAGSFDRRRMRRLAWDYHEFPLFNSTKDWLNMLSQNVPLLLLSCYFGPTVTGCYALGVRVLQLPMNLVGISLSQVFFQKASETYNAGGNVHGLFRKTTLGLAALVAVPTVLALLFAPPVFAFVLGSQWWTAGEYARWLVFWLVVAFAATPALLCAQIYRKQKHLFLVNLGLLGGRTGALVVGGYYCDALHTIILFSLVGVIFNAGIIAWMWLVTWKKPCPGAAS
jgi:lipopolysaccharide exporter